MNHPQAPAANRDPPAFIGTLLQHPLTLFLARAMLCAPFIAGGLAKLLHWRAGIDEMAHFGLHPAWAFNAAVLGLQLVGSALILLNRHVWLAAGALAVFTMLATLVAHRFWSYPAPERFMQMNTFLEHVAICAAFILVTVVDLRRRRDRGPVTI
ncbi:MAG: DoxX family protein [Steroidobacteraceae bacterium]